jgi:hypothetical protein
MMSLRVRGAVELSVKFVELTITLSKAAMSVAKVSVKNTAFTHSHPRSNSAAVTLHTGHEVGAEVVGEAVGKAVGEADLVGDPEQKWVGQGRSMSERPM